jgi:hypothetical protein
MNDCRISQTAFVFPDLGRSNTPLAVGINPHAGFSYVGSIIQCERMVLVIVFHLTSPWFSRRPARSCVPVSSSVRRRHPYHHRP